MPINAEEKKALLIVLAFLMFFLLVPITWHGTGPDYPFHWSLANDKCPIMEGWTKDSCQYYYPLFQWVSKFFAAKESIFKFFTLFLFAVVTPLLLFLISRKAIAVWFYFSITSYFYFINAGLYSQGLSLMLLLGLFATKNNLIRLGILLLSLIAHSTSFWLCSFAFFLILLRGTLEGVKIRKLTKFLPFCSPFWGGEMPEVMKTRVVGDIGSRYPPDFVTINHVFSFFVKICPLPFLYWGIRGLLSRNRWDMVLIIAISFFGAFFLGHRVFYMAPLMMIPGLAWYYEKCEYKRLILILSFVYLIIQLEQWFAIATQIFC